MPAYDKLVDHLPSLWRPQRGDATLLAQWLAAVGAAFDAGAADIQHVLRAHWFDTADAAAWAKHFAADRRERSLGALRIGNAADRGEALRYPHVRDLPRLAALLDLPPWRDPASLREEVEEYRARVGDVLGAYRAGLVTPGALRRLVDAALPEDMSAAPAAQRTGYAVEEPVSTRLAPIPLTSTPNVAETDRVAALARWKLTGSGRPGFVIAGVAADAIGGTTEAPMLERYLPDAAVKGIGVAYTGTLAPGQALRLLPGRRQWLLRGAELLASAPPSATNEARDPSANGPFEVATTLDAGRAAALCGACDGSLWLIQRSGSTHTVERFDGSALQAVGADAPAGAYNALASAGDSVWLGTDEGLFRCRLFPEDGVLRWVAAGEVQGAVRVLVPNAAEGLVAAGAQGVCQLGAFGNVVEHRHAALDLRAYSIDGNREVMATERTLHIARHGKRWRYAATGVSESLADWVEEAADADEADSPLPPVQHIAVTADGSLWIGGPGGLARWFADADGTTRLAAFPDLFAGAVLGLAVDERGLLRIVGDDGLFRFDGRDLAQFDFATSTWLPLGDADLIYPEPLRSEPRGHWQFDRTGGRWQRFDARAQRFANVELAARAAPSEAIAALLVQPALQAEVGHWDGAVFSDAQAVLPTDIMLRIKPDETRCVDAGMPYLPADTEGARWRYLQLDRAPAPPAEGRPWWSTEGQLFRPPQRSAPVPGHRRDDPAFLADPEHEGQFDRSAFAYAPSAKVWALSPASPAVGIRVRLFAPDPAQPFDPAIAERVWQLISRARPAGIPLQLMAEGTVFKESPS
ncbi:MAG: hypothetical protein ABIO45_01845 [Burkholderiaceae bacterium]